MNFWKKLFITSLVILTGWINLSPVALSLWQWRDGMLFRADWPSAAFPVSGPDVHEPAIELNDGKLMITSPSGQWESPENWIVQQAAWTDLNHDSRPEATLLVRRPFQPWPVDRVLPHGGRISHHQDSDGMSSHIILIGWKKDHWGELWAGSALARPVRSFFTVDANKDGVQELITREGRYQDTDPSYASTLAVWQWNGFGFDLVSRVEKPSRCFTVITDSEQNCLMLLQ